MKNIFIVGSKGIPANYGGFETFVEQLTSKKESSEIKYHVACKARDDKETEYNGARCFNVNVKNIGPAQAIFYDVDALKSILKYVEENNINEGIVYILACRIGPFMKKYVKLLHAKNIKVFVNPDGHEWKRAKWNWFVRKYWKISEKMMVKHADLLICDSQNIEKYIQEDYKKYQPKTTFIPYGADIPTSIGTDAFDKWSQEHDVKSNEYYLIVGRFVPENNYETMIREFKSSGSKKDLVIITDKDNKLYGILNHKLHFESDKRIKFVGTVYDSELLTAIRKNAFAYIHGHSVGGTNPSLLEALATTKLNLLLNVGFNVEVGKESAVYWGLEKGSLKQIIETVEDFSEEYIDDLEKESTQRIKDDYSWNKIIKDYEDLFLNKSS